VAITKRWDVLGLGCATVDDLLYVAAFPAPDTKTRVLRSERQCGGLTATALVAASRLGARCAYGGSLGRDPHSLYVAEHMEREGIDLSQVAWRDDARPIHSVIVVDTSRHTRNIFYEIAGRVGPDEDAPAADAITAARVLFIDHYGGAGNVRAARLAREAGVPVVGDFERADAPAFDAMLPLVDHLIVGRAFALRLTGAADASAAARALWNAERDTVVVTGGEAGCWAVSREAPREVWHQPALAVDAIDTTGCGDVFHGAYAAALAEGQPLAQRLRFATAAAALKATRRGAQAGAPTRDEVDELLREAWS